LTGLSSAASSAQTAGTLASEEGRGSTTSNAPAESAGSPSPSTSTASNRTAVVYALTVADQHEYFANGVLVSNCDSHLYSWRYALNYIDFEPEQKEETAAERAERMDEELLARVTEPTEWWEDEPNDEFE
jgi:hypothetical protein